RNLARDARAENLRSFRDDREARFHELLPDIGAFEDQAEFLREPVDNRLRRPGWRVNPLERIGDGVLHPELLERRHVRKIGPALPRVTAMGRTLPASMSAINDPMLAV